MRSSAGTAWWVTSRSWILAVPATVRLTGSGVDSSVVFTVSRATAWVPESDTAEAEKPVGGIFEG